MMLFILLLAIGEEIKGELRVGKDGETVTIDLAQLKALVPQFPKDPSGFTVEHAGKKRVPEAWTIELPEVREKMEIVVTHATLDLKIVLAAGASAGRRCAVKPGLLYGREAVWIAVEQCGDGKWEFASVPWYDCAAENGPSINGVAVSALCALASCSGSAFYGVPPAAVQPWRAVAEKYYRSVTEDDYANFVSCYNKTDRATADKYSTCRLHWRAARNFVDKMKLRAYEFDRFDEKRSDEKYRKLFYRRMDESGKQIGMAVPIVLTIEDGQWVVISATQ